MNSEDVPNMKTEDQYKLKNLILDPITFSKFVLEFNPFPYQSDFLKDGSKRIVVCAGRQVGKSEMTSARAIWFAISHPKTNTLIVSATLRQSMLMFDKIISKIESSPLIESYLKYRSRTRLRFKNGSWIIALPCGRTGATLRGHTAHQIILDEAAFIPESVVAEVALPMLSTTDGTAIMLSTPFDKSHIFYKAFTSPHWSKYHFPSSMNPMIRPEFLEEQRELSGEQAFEQEYMAEFVEDAKSYFPMPLLRTCIHICVETTSCEYCGVLSDFNQLLNAPRKKLFGGYDPGGKQDPAAFVVVEKLPDNSLRFILQKTYLSKNKSGDENLYTNFTVEIADLNQKLQLQELDIDSTGLGNPIVEHCKELKLPAVGLPLSARLKEQILSNLRLLIENKRIVLPPDILLLTNLNCIEADRTHSGGFSFSHPKGSHDDLAYALALACWAGTNYQSGSVIIMKS